MSLNLLLDAEDDDDTSPAISGSQALNLECLLPSQLSIDTPVTAEEDAHDLEWEDESDVNMLLRASSHTNTPKSVSYSPVNGSAAHTPPADIQADAPPVAPDSGLAPSLTMPPAVADTHCTFKEEVIGTDAEGGTGSQYEELMPGLYFVGIHRVEVEKSQRAFLLVVRPDVAAQSILDLVEQVLMSFGGAVAHYTHHDVLPLPQAATAKSNHDQNKTAGATTEGKSDSSGAAYPQQVREIRGVHSTDCWDSISVFLGTDVYKRRVLCVVASPFSATSIGTTMAGMLGGGVYHWLSGSRDANAADGTSVPNSGMVKKCAEDIAQGSEGALPFDSTVLSLVGSLMGALEDEKMTASHIGLLTHLSNHSAKSSAGDIDSMQKKQVNGNGASDNSALQYNPPADLVGEGLSEGSKAGGKPLESLVDPLFVRDLMGSYAQELRYNLEAVGVSLDSFVEKLEKQCARLMTTVKPMYQRCGLAVPAPPVKKPLSSFQLVMPDSQTFLVSNVVAEEASGVGVNLARLMILRARRAYLNSRKEAGADVLSSAATGVELSELRYVLTHIFRQLRRYSETEARARVLRKTDAVTARITDIENYRLQLLRVLHKRFDSTVSVVSSEDNFASVDHVVPEQALSANEKDSMALFISRFRIATYEEPPLVDFPSYFFGTVPISDSSGKGAVNMVSRWGHMYVTHKDIFFHADAAAIRNVMGLFSKSTSGAGEVIQLVLPISTISKCRCGHKISPAIGSTLGKKKETAMELQDSVGNIYIFGMPAGSPPQYADRVCDLFTILQSCVLSGHNLNEPSATPAPIEAVLASVTPDIPKSSASSSQEKKSAGGSVAPQSDTSAKGKSERIACKEEGSILSSRKEAFSHVMKLASSALDSALPGKFRSAAAAENSASKVEAQPGGLQGSEEQAPNRRDDSVLKKKDVSKGDTEGWYQSAPIGASLSVSSGAHVSTHEQNRSADSSPNVAAASSDTSGQSKAPPGRRPKPASLGKNIQMFLQQQQQKKN